MNVAALDLERSLQIVMGTGGEGATITVIGMAIISEEIINTAMDSIGNLFPIAVLAIAAILLFIYRNLLDTFIGLLGFGMAIIWI